MEHLSILNLITSVFGFIVAGMLIFSDSHNRKVNFLLGIAFSISAYRSLTLFLLNYGLIRNTIVMGNMSFSYYFIPPAFYLYFRQLINDGEAFKRKDIIHVLIPGLMTLLPFAYLFITLAMDGHAYLPEQSLDIHQPKPFAFYLSVKEHAYLITIISLIYLTLSWRTLLKDLRVKPNEHPQVKVIRSWIRSIIIIGTMMTTVLLLSSILTWATGIQSRMTLGDFGVIRNIIVLILFSSVLFKKDLLFGIPAIPSSLPTVEEKNELVTPSETFITSPQISEKSVSETVIEYPEDFDEFGWVIDNIGTDDSNIESEKIVLYIREVTDYIRTKPYLDPEFNMKYISKELDVPHYHIEYLFRYYNRHAFTEFRNMLRVRHVIEKFNEGAQEILSLEGIGKEAGFSSRSSFFRVFKQITGKSPKQYAEGSDEEDEEEDD